MIIEDYIQQCHDALRRVLETNNHHYILIVTDKSGLTVHTSSSLPSDIHETLLIAICSRLKKRLNNALKKDNPI